MIDSLGAIVAGIRGYALKTDARRIADAVAGDELLTPPDWMQQFVADIANGRSSDCLLRIPMGYPRGENGLINVLLEVDATVCPLGIEDSGEQLFWALPHNNVQVFIGRETAGNYFLAAVRPADTDLNSWLHNEYDK